MCGRHSAPQPKRRDLHALLRPFAGAMTDKIVGPYVNSPGREEPRYVEVDETPGRRALSLPDDKQAANDISWRQRPASVSLVPWI